LAPFLESYPEKRAVSIAHAAQKAEAGHGGVIFDPRRFPEDFLDLLADGIGPFHGGGEGKLHANEYVPLVLLRQKSRWQFFAKPTDRASHQTKKDHADGRLADQSAAHADIAVGGAAIDAIETVEASAQRPPGFLARTQQERGKRRTKGAGVKGRNEHGDSD